MKLLLITDTYWPEASPGAIRSTAHARRWAALGHDVTVVTGFPNFPEGRIYPGYRQSLWQRTAEAGVTVIRVPTLMFPNAGTVRRLADFLSFMLSGFVAAMFVRRPQIVVATSPQFFAAVAGCFAAALRRLPFVFEVRDLWPEAVVAVGAMRDRLPIRIARRIEQLLYRRAALVVTVTEATRRYLAARGVPPRRLLTIPNGADPAQFAAADGEAVRARLGTCGRIVVSWIGTVGMAQPVELLVDTAARLKTTAPEIAVLVVGSGARWDGFKRTVADRGLHNVILVERVPHRDIAAYWMASDLALVLLKDQPLFRTVLPSKLYEALAAGLPVITNVEGEMARIADTHGGIVGVPGATAETLAAAVMALAVDSGRRRALGEQARAASAHFDRTVEADRLAGHLETVAAPAADRIGRPARAGAVQSSDDYGREGDGGVIHR